MNPNHSSNVSNVPLTDSLRSETNAVPLDSEIGDGIRPLSDYIQEELRGDYQYNKKTDDFSIDNHCFGLIDGPEAFLIPRPHLNFQMQKIRPLRKPDLSDGFVESQPNDRRYCDRIDYPLYENDETETVEFESSSPDAFLENPVSDGNLASGWNDDLVKSDSVAEFESSSSDAFLENPPSDGNLVSSLNGEQNDDLNRKSNDAAIEEPVFISNQTSISPPKNNLNPIVSELTPVASEVEQFCPSPSEILENGIFFEDQKKNDDEPVFVVDLDSERSPGIRTSRFQLFNRCESIVLGQNAPTVSQFKPSSLESKTDATSEQTRTSARFSLFQRFVSLASDARRR